MSENESAAMKAEFERSISDMELRLRRDFAESLSTIHEDITVIKVAVKTMEARMSDVVRVEKELEKVRDRTERQIKELSDKYQAKIKALEDKLDEANREIQSNKEWTARFEGEKNQRDQDAADRKQFNNRLLGGLAAFILISLITGAWSEYQRLADVHRQQTSQQQMLEVIKEALEK